MGMRTSLEAMQKEVTEGKKNPKTRDSSPSRRRFNVKGYKPSEKLTACQCAVETASKVVCQECKKAYCRACSFWYEDDYLDMRSCKDCCLLDPDPVPTGYRAPDGCGELYLEASFKKHRSYPTEDSDE